MPADGFYNHIGSLWDLAFWVVRKIWDGLTTFSHCYNLATWQGCMDRGGLTIHLKIDWTAPYLLQKQSNI
jgi:hypothetical protein